MDNLDKFFAKPIELNSQDCINVKNKTAPSRFKISLGRNGKGYSIACNALKGNAEILSEKPHMNWIRSLRWMCIEVKDEHSKEGWIILNKNSLKKAIGIARYNIFKTSQSLERELRDRLGDQDWLASIEKLLERPADQEVHDVIELIEQGDFDQALEVANTIPNANHKSEAIYEIIQGFVRQGEWERALKSSYLINSRKTTSTILNKIYDLFDEIIGQFFKDDKLDLALEIANGMPEEALKIQIIKRISSKLAENGEFDRALEAAKAISDDWGVEKALVIIIDIIGVLMREGHFERAREMVPALPKNGSQDCCLSWIASTLAQKGDVDQALELAAMIDDNQAGYKSAPLLEVAKQPLTESQRNLTRNITNTIIVSTIADDQAKNKVLELLSTHS
ncbi:MAG: hypothetical protein K0S07_148 [Chlamydiales bacterium]|jgi:thioredoxin-like negative regulator of GroEL|nr:hypothetical protein [Chlamydiales bacterium]